MKDPFNYFAAQAPNFPVSVHEFSPQALSMTLQMSNVLLLLAPMAILCCWTKHSEIAFWYLIAVGFADYGHIYATYVAVGPEYFGNPAGWNNMIAGNVGVSAFLNINQWLTVLGVFGNLQTTYEEKKKRT